MRSSVLIVMLSATGMLGAACTLLLSKEPLTCATNADCAKYPGTTCQETECRPGQADQQDGSVTDATDANVDAPIPFDGSDPCSNPNKPVVEVKGDLTGNITWTCENDYLLVGRVALTSLGVITVQPGTTIYGSTDVEPVTNVQGTLIIKPTARLIAVGTPDKPIIFTSSKKRPGAPVTPDGGAASGDWGGVYLLGEAPVNTTGGVGVKDGLGPHGSFGGNKPNDDSGRLEYVRIEYGGAKFPAGQDGVSLDLAGVGDKTFIDHIMFRWPGDDCVEIIGGTVNIRHMLCQYPFDDGIAWENGWTGKVQFVVVQGRPGINNNSNALQGRSGGSGTPALPRSAPTIYNATFCGQNILPFPTREEQQYGIRAEQFSHFHIVNTIVTGWEAAMDLRGDNYAQDAIDAGAGPGFTFRNSISYGNLTAANIAYDETTGAGTTKDPFFNDDLGFDEANWWSTQAFANSTVSAAIPKCFDPDSPRFATANPIGANGTGNGNPTAAQPPNDGFFDPNAKYIGAFKDQTDQWAVGKWVLWSSQ
jgi:hypothetical protein